MIILKTLLILLILNFHAFSQLKAIGRILKGMNDSIPIGTAFVAGNQKAIYTCSHVVINDTLWFNYIGSDFVYRVTVKYNLPNFDIALLERTGGEQPASLEFGNFNKVQPGDKVKYIGWDQRVNKYGLWDGIVSAKGSALTSDQCSAEFIEFEGNAIPGYSGGPVFNDQGKVIAIMREAWSKKGIKGGNMILINRAFSVELLRILESEVKMHSSPSDNKSGISIINLIKK